MDFSGESIVIHPNGSVLAKADDTEQLLVCEVDLSEAKKLKESSVSFHTETGMVQDLKNGTKENGPPEKWVTFPFHKVGALKEYR